MAAWGCRLALTGSLWLAVFCAASALSEGVARAEEAESEWNALVMVPQAQPARGRVVRAQGRKKRLRGGGAPHRETQRGWHEPITDDYALHEGHAFPPLVIHAVGQAEPYVLEVQSGDGDFDDAAHAVARAAFGAWEGGPSVHPRLLELMYRAMRHFGVPSLHLVSGLRRDRQASRHSHGMAADIVLPGVDDGDLATFFRGQGFAGVGTYPGAGFVHIDVRAASYFWVDRSPPGRRSKLHQVRADEARAADAEALLRGVKPATDPVPLERALTKRAERKRTVHKRTVHKRVVRKQSRGGRRVALGGA